MTVATLQLNLAIDGCHSAFALRELRGGLRGFYVFIACIALGSMAIAGVGIAGGKPRRRAGARRPGHPRRRSCFTLIQREATAGRNGIPERPRRSFERRHHARDGAHGQTARQHWSK